MIISRHANHVIGIENGKEAVEDAKRNAARNGVGNARFLAEDAAVALPRLIKEGMRPQVIVADPPRKGMDPAVIEAILASGAPRLIYVSCDPATLARDVKLLTQGGYRLEQAQPVDMFPQTAHVECVCLLTRTEE
jgi:23S rRNA (uracil1939-C5)-methyltransferase